jgi:hypothetical protein
MSDRNTSNKACNVINHSATNGSKYWSKMRCCTMPIIVNLSRVTQVRSRSLPLFHKWTAGGLWCRASEEGELFRADEKGFGGAVNPTTMRRSTIVRYATKQAELRVVTRSKPTRRCAMSLQHSHQRRPLHFPLHAEAHDEDYQPAVMWAVILR